MSQRFVDKTALVTGAARGQGRAHAIRLAQEGTDVIVLDICQTLPTTGYEGPTVEDLDETVRLVEKEAGGPWLTSSTCAPSPPYRLLSTTGARSSAVSTWS